MLSRKHAWPLSPGRNLSPYPEERVKTNLASGRAVRWGLAHSRERWSVMWGPEQSWGYISEGDFGEVLLDLESQGSEIPCDKILEALLEWGEVPWGDSGPSLLEGVVMTPEGQEALVISRDNSSSFGKLETYRRLFFPTPEQMGVLRRFLEDRQKGGKN